MATQTIINISLGLLLVVAIALFLRTAWRILAFRLLREHREVVLKSAYLLDEKHNLSEQEGLAVAMSIDLLYDYKVKRILARETAKNARTGNNSAKNANEPLKHEGAIRVVRAFAAITMVENPFCLFTVLWYETKRKNKSKLATSGVLPMARAEIRVQSSLYVAEEYVKKHDLLTCV